MLSIITTIFSFLPRDKYNLEYNSSALLSLIPKIEFDASLSDSQHVLNAREALKNMVKPVDEDCQSTNYVLNHVLKYNYVWYDGQSMENKIYYLHGGGYVAGSFSNYHGFMCRLSKKFEIPIIFLDYELAPEVKLDYMVNQSVDLFYYLVRNKDLIPDKTIIMGDSAGGGLATLTLHKILSEIREENKLKPLPKLLILSSAYIDINGELTLDEKDRTDRMSNNRYLKMFARVISGSNEQAVKDSPVFFDWDFRDIVKQMDVRLPKILMNWEETEIISTSNEHLSNTMKGLGWKVNTITRRGLAHCYIFFEYMFGLSMTEAKEDMRAIQMWIQWNINE